MQYSMQDTLQQPWGPVQYAVCVSESIVLPHDSCGHLNIVGVKHKLSFYVHVADVDLF